MNILNKKQISKLYITIISTLFLFFFSSCEKEFTFDKIVGTWQLEVVEEDGVLIDQSNSVPVILLFEQNGVVRSNQKNNLTNNEYSPNYFSAWSITDNTFLELGIDSWKLSLTPLLSNVIKDQWISMYLPVRFTILKLDETEMHIRIRAFVGDVKYAVQFREPELVLITNENYEIISNEFKTIRTYIYKFIRK